MCGKWGLSWGPASSVLQLQWCECTGEHNTIAIPAPTLIQGANGPQKSILHQKLGLLTCLGGIIYQLSHGCNQSPHTHFACILTRFLSRRFWRDSTQFLKMWSQVQDLLRSLPYLTYAVPGLLSREYLKTKLRQRPRYRYCNDSYVDIPPQMSLLFAACVRSCFGRVMHTCTMHHLPRGWLGGDERSSIRLRRGIGASRPAGRAASAPGG